MPTGFIKFFDPVKGYGFIGQQDGTDIFVHESAVPEDAILQPGVPVEFELESDDRGRPRAAHVKLLGVEKSAGTVKFYDAGKGFGFIARDDGHEVFIHRSSLTGDRFQVLVAGERVEFQAVPDPSREGALRAISAAPLSSVSRLGGIVKSFDHMRGFGFIEPSNADSEDLFFHFSDILGGGVRTAVEGEEVEYELESDERGTRAVRIKRLDPRLPLFCFANLGPKDEWVEALVALAEPENWDYRRPPERQESANEAPDAKTEAAHEQRAEEAYLSKPILRSYIIYTFARVQEEDKIARGEEHGRQFACFNTGLVTPMQEAIFALFEQNPTAEADGSLWRLQGFHAKSDRVLISKFERLPELANYFDDPSELLYDRRRELILDIPHIVRDHLHRFPESCRENEYLAQQLPHSANLDFRRPGSSGLVVRVGCRLGVGAAWLLGSRGCGAVE